MITCRGWRVKSASVVIIIHTRAYSTRAHACCSAPPPPPARARMRAATRLPYLLGRAEQRGVVREPPRAAGRRVSVFVCLLVGWFVLFACLFVLFASLFCLVCLFVCLLVCLFVCLCVC